MSRFLQTGYCEHCPRVEVSGLSWCVVCGNDLNSPRVLNLGLSLLIDACAGLNNETVDWLMGRSPCE